VIQGLAPSNLQNGKAAMKPPERERMMELVKQIAEEKDHKKFLQLIEELTSLLDDKAHRLKEQTPLPPNTET
jgi:hypothetical protein